MLDIFIINESRFSDSFITTKIKNTGGAMFNYKLLDKVEFPRELPEKVRGDAAEMLAEQASIYFKGIVVAFTRANVVREVSCAVIDSYINETMLYSSCSVARLTHEMGLDILRKHKLI